MTSFSVARCAVHQPRHVRVLTWLDLDPTRGMTVSKGERTLVEEKDL